MSERIGKYHFDGPYRSTKNLKDKLRVFAVISSWDCRLVLVDVGKSDDVKLCRADVTSGSGMGYTVVCTQNERQEERFQIKEKILTEFDVPGGE